MDQHQKRYIKPGDLLFANRSTSDASASPNDHTSETRVPDAVQDNPVTSTNTAQKTKQVTPIKGPRLHHPFYADPLLSRDTNGATIRPLASEESIIHTSTLNDNAEAISTPVSNPATTHVFDVSSTSLSDLLKNPHALGIMLEHTYKTTNSDEMRQVIACLVNLDVMITRQSRLNELHEAHTAKNFREQRHLNKDRKLHHSATTKSVNHKFAGLDSQRMAQETTLKQCEIRTNSHAFQLKGLIDKTRMLAEGGESMEREINGMEQIITDLQGELEALKLANVDLIDQVRGLTKEVRDLKEKEHSSEDRLRALEGKINDKKETRLVDVCVKKGQVLNAASFAVGNGRVFPFSG